MQTVRHHLPGLLLAVVLAGASLLLASLTSFGLLALCVLVGAVASNLVRLPDATEAGLRFAGRTLLRIGVVLLGFELTLGQVGRLGLDGLAVVIITVIATFLATLWLGRRLGVSRGLTMLTATGFSICGASAIAAARGVVDADDDETAYAVGLVTLCGSLAIVVLPVIAAAIGMPSEMYGAWVGASVHDVAQVVAAASIGGSVVALNVAIVVKLTRVLLLVPLIAVLGTVERRSGGSTALPMPWFVAAFLAAVIVRSLDIVPDQALDVVRVAQAALLALALVALGTGVKPERLRHLGLRPLLLGLLSWLTVAIVAYVGVTLAT